LVYSWQRKNQRRRQEGERGMTSRKELPGWKKEIGVKEGEGKDHNPKGKINNKSSFSKV